jgi:hypothetical protein
MFQLLRKGGTEMFLKARGARRDSENDHERLLPIGQSIDAALAGAEAEHAGLKRRIGEVVARVAVTLGNDSDEYLHRDPRDDENQRLFDEQMAAGTKRLEQLSDMITHLKSLQAAFNVHFRGEALADQV